MAPTFAVLFARGEAKLAIAAVILGLALSILAIRVFYHFIAWITNDGHPLRRITVAGLFLFPLALLALPFFPPAVEAFTPPHETLQAPQTAQPQPPASPVTIPQPAPRPLTGRMPGERISVVIGSPIDSVGGCHRYRNVRASFQLIGSAERSIPTVDILTKDSNWGSVISVPRYGPSTQRVFPSASVALPNDESLYGREAIVTVEATVEYPGFVSGFDPNVALSTRGDLGDRFVTRSVKVKATQKVQFVSRDELARFQQEKACFDQEEARFQHALARHSKAMATYHSQLQEWDRAKQKRWHAEARAEREAQSQASAQLRWGWLGVPLCLLAVPFACRLGRRD